MRRFLKAFQLSKFSGFWRPPGVRMKTVLWRSPGLTFRAGARNALKLSSEGSWAHSPGWDQKCFKTVLWRPAGPTFRAGPRNPSEPTSGGLLGSLSGLCSTNPMLDKAMFRKNPMFNKLYVQQTLCSTHPCSTKLC